MLYLNIKHRSPQNLYVCNQTQIVGCTRIDHHTPIDRIQLYVFKLVRLQEHAYRPQWIRSGHKNTEKNTPHTTPTQRLQMEGLFETGITENNTEMIEL